MIDSRGGSEPRAAERSLPSMPVRVTRGELERWKASAAAQGLTLSAWVRETLDAASALAETTASLRALPDDHIAPAAMPPAEPKPPPSAGHYALLLWEKRQREHLPSRKAADPARADVSDRDARPAEDDLLGVLDEVRGELAARGVTRIAEPEPARVPVAAGQLRRDYDGTVWMVETCSATIHGAWVLSRWETGFGRRWLHGVSADVVAAWPLADEPSQRDTLPAPPGDE